MIPRFERDHMEGQMHDPERKALWEIVVALKPEKVFEIACWLGGGSTYFITSALHENGNGHLWTCELHPEFLDHAVALYKSGDLKELNPYVTFHLGSGEDIFPPVLAKEGPIDMAFLDGGEGHNLSDAQQQARELAMMKEHLRVGGMIAFHDWGLNKTALTRVIMQNDMDFEMVDSVMTLATFRKVK